MQGWNIIGKSLSVILMQIATCSIIFQIVPLGAQLKVYATKPAVHKRFSMKNRAAYLKSYE